MVCTRTAVCVEYSEWRNFNKVIEKAKTACGTSGIDVQDHFVNINKMVEIGSGAGRKIDDIMLSPLCVLSNCNEQRS